MLFSIKDRSLHPIWKSEDYVSELRRLAAVCISLVRIPKADRNRATAPLWEDVEAAASAGGYHVDEEQGDLRQAYLRFINFQGTPDDARLLDALALIVFKKLDDWSKETESDTPRLKYRHIGQAFTQNNIVDKFEEFKRSKNSGDYAKARDVTSKHFNGSKIGTDQLISVPQSQYDAASIYLTGTSKNQEHKRVFACYRYSSVTGHIAKSLITVYANTDRDDICRFESRFNTINKTLKLARGVVFKDGDWTYMIGQMTSSSSLEVLTLRSVGDVHPPIMQGVLLSRTQRPIVARLALKYTRTLIPPEEVRTSLERGDQEFSSEDFIINIRPKIRNEIAFELSEKLIFNDGNEELGIDQSEMVAKVGELLRGKFFLIGKNEERIPFNPAKHLHYPFNQAISIQDG